MAASPVLNDVARYELDGDIAVVTINSPPVNALSAAVRHGIAAGIDRALADPQARAIVLICEGRTFFAGADITEFGKPPVSPSLYEVQDMIEAATKPVVVAIHGTAFGGGLEVALVGHYRVAVPSAKLGLPEVKLGLLPGAGGTQRLPRVVGAEKALAMVTSGEPVTAAEAQATGLLDAVTEEGGLREGAVAHARRVLAEGRPLRKIRDQDEKLVVARGDPSLFARYRAENARKYPGFIAPDHNLRCVEAAVNMTFEEGIAFERARFRELMDGPQSAALRHIFFAERQVARVPGLSADVAPMPIARVGVVGAGFMGGGIAMSFIDAGIPVTLIDRDQGALDRGLGAIRSTYDRIVGKGALSAAAAEQRIGLISPSLDLFELDDCDLVVEAVFEDLAIKQDMFRRLDGIVRPGAILATNTSFLDVDAIASATVRPESVVGLHFFSPANLMRLLEIVRGAKTADAVLATVSKLAKTIGKIGVVVGNGPGFVGNRMLEARQAAADILVRQGVSPWAIDRALEGFGMPIGPFKLLDLIGLDLGWRPKGAEPTPDARLCAMGRLGRKNGKGFYDYEGGRPPSPSAETETMLADLWREAGARPIEMADDEIVARTLYPLVNEGAKILAEGRANRPSDIDVIWVTGYSWPAYRGGPMFWADQVGLDRVLSALDEWTERHGETYRPAPLLGQLVADGKRFADL